MKKEECLDGLGKDKLTYEQIRKFLGLVEGLDEARELYYMQGKIDEMQDIDELANMLEKTKEYELFMWKMLKKMGIIVKGDYDIEKGHKDVKHAYNALISLDETLQNRIEELARNKEERENEQ